MFIGILLLDLSFIVYDAHGEMAGSVIIDIGVQVLPIVSIEPLCPTLRDVLIPKVFSHYRPILGLHHTVVVGMSRSALCETDQQLVQNVCYYLVDELRAVV